MEEVKNYTDIEQGKLLKDIFPIDTADMCYLNLSNHGVDCADEFKATMTPYTECVKLSKSLFGKAFDDIVPAWSLAKLIKLLPNYLKDSCGLVYQLRMDKDYVEYSNDNISGLYSIYIHTTGEDNLVDACVHMIKKLKEEKLM